MAAELGGRRSGLMLAMATLVTSLVLWRAAPDRRSVAGDQVQPPAQPARRAEDARARTTRAWASTPPTASDLLTGHFSHELVQAATNVVKPFAVQNEAGVVARVREVWVISAADPGGTKVAALVDQRATSVTLRRPQLDQNRFVLAVSLVETAAGSSAKVESI